MIQKKKKLIAILNIANFAYLGLGFPINILNGINEKITVKRVHNFIKIEISYFYCHLNITSDIHQKFATFI